MKLNIQLFASGSFEFQNWNSGTAIRGKIEWSSTPIENQNKSRVTASIYARRTSGSTTGRTWNGYIDIGGNVHDFDEIYTATSTTVGTSWVLIDYYTDVIEHNADGTKTITIRGEVYGPSGTSLAGKSSWGSGTATLDTLHKAPVLNYVGFTEENQTLLNLGIADNQFVPFLSQKNISLNMTLYDNAILSAINWRFQNLELDTLSLVPILSPSATPPSDTGTFTYTKLVDFATRNLAYTQVGDKYYTKAGYVIFDNSSAKYMTPNEELTQYEVIPYETPTLISTTTNARRDGQTSGKVNLNVNATFYNKIIGTTQNSIQVMYKFWEKESTEPTTYITIPSSSITITDNNIEVSNYPIGSDVTTASNYFDYQKSYYVQVKIIDLVGSSNELSVPISIPLGEALVSEYKDRWDFKKLTIKNNNPFEYDNETIVGYYNNKPIYRIILHSTKTISGGSSGTVGYLDNPTKIMSLTGAVKIGANWLSLPASHPNSFNYQVGMYYDNSDKSITVETGSGRTVTETFVVCLYFKD